MGRGPGGEALREEMEILYFPAATQLRPADEKGGPATAKILNAAGVDYGILGAKENCCGESIRKTGDEELFKRLAKENIKTFIDNGVKKIWSPRPTATTPSRTNTPNSWWTSRWFTWPSSCSSSSRKAA
jgi:Fe-S oxidoreductase